MFVVDLFQLVLLFGLFWKAQELHRALFLDGNGALVSSGLFYLVGVLIQLLVLRNALPSANKRRLILLTGPALLMAFLLVVGTIIFLHSGATKEIYSAAAQQRVPKEFYDQWMQNHLVSVNADVTTCALLTLCIGLLYVSQFRALVRDDRDRAIIDKEGAAPSMGSE